MVTFTNQKPQDLETTDSPNWALSMAAAIPSGIIKNLKEGPHLVQRYLDLGVDRDRVEAVEQYFDKINPFDELSSINRYW